MAEGQATLGETTCSRRADGQHEYDWSASDTAFLTSYARGADRSAVVRLSKCRACRVGLVAVATADSDDDDLGLVITVVGLEVGE